jgi:hypothetical protein
MPMRWVAPGLNADSLVLVLSGNQKSLRSTLVPQQGDTAVAESPAPGHYSYDIVAYSGGKEIARSSGPITVETFSPEYMRRPVDLKKITGAPTSLAHAGARAGRPLHTYPWVYVLIVALLCTEWVLRRRWGLR